MHSRMDQVERRLKLAVAFLVIASYATLATTDAHPASLVLIPLIALMFMPFTERIDRRSKAFRTLTRAVTILFAAAMTTLFMMFLEMYGPQLALVRSVMLLVMYIQIFSLLHNKNEQNFHHILLMSFFLLLIALVSEPTASIGLSLTFFLLAMAASLVTLEAYAVRRSSKQAAPAAIVELTQKELPREQIRNWRLELLSSSWLFASTLSILILAVAFFLLTPRTEIGLLGGLDTGNSFVTGLSVEVDLAEGGLIQQDTSIVMRVVFPDRPDGRYDQPMFWRATTFDQYTGNGWSRQGLRWIGSRFNPYARRFSVMSGPKGSHEGVHRIDLEKRPTIRQQIFLDQPSPTGLPVLSQPRTVVPDDKSGTYRMAWDPNGDFTVMLSPKGRSGFSYTVWSYATAPTPEELTNAPADFQKIVRKSDYRLLTGHNLLPKTVDLVQEITRDAPTPYEKIVAVQDWLSKGEFTYSLNVPNLPDDHPVDEFIHDVKLGHCELYASAMALMVRSIGIPARVVSGYRGGNLMPDGSYIISADMAHLWVEIFFPEYGWITFDPSPERETVGRTELQSFVELYDRIALRTKLFWLRNVVGFTAEDRFEMFGNFSIGALLGRPAATTKTPAAPTQDRILMVGPSPQTVAQVAMICLAVLACFTLYRTFRSRRRAYAFTADQKRALRLYHQMTRRAERLGVPAAGLSAEELCLALSECHPHTLPNARAVVQAYNDARFGTRALPQTRYQELRAKIKALAGPQH